MYEVYTLFSLVMLLNLNQGFSASHTHTHIYVLSTGNSLRNPKPRVLNKALVPGIL